MGSRYQRFYKSRGGNFGRQGFVAGIEEDQNRYSTFSLPGQSSRHRQIRVWNRRNPNRNHPNPLNRRNVTTAPWYRVTIVNGKLMGFENLLKELSSYTEGVLNPVRFSSNDDGDVEFMLEDKEMAQAVQSASRRLSTPTGKKLIISITTTKAPVVSLQPDDIDALKKLLDRRYDPANNTVNLSGVGDDPTIKQENGNYLPLSRSNVMLTIAGLLGQVCPTLRSVDLSKNRLRFLDFVTNLAICCPVVVMLNISENLIESMLELEKLWPWKNNIVDLNLELNPLCKRFRDSSSYVTAVRRLFPKLVRLDGVELPPAFRTGIEEELSSRSALPSFKPSFYVNDDLKILCDKFITELFNIFDNRDPKKREYLLAAYDDDAVFSLTAHNLTEEANRIRSDCWQEFVRDSHNIKNIAIWARYRSKLVQKGRISIISYFVNNFPAVEHDRSSFIVDVSFASNDLICLNVSGVYKLLSNPSANGALRFFTRSFLIIPKNEGLAVINEELFCTTMTSAQETSYRRKIESFHQGPSTSAQMMQQSSSSAAMINSSQPLLSNATTAPIGFSANGNDVASTSNAQQTAVSEQAAKRQMVEIFSKQTRMKEQWADHCLNQNDWDLNRALFVFNQLNQDNKIPPEAFRS